MLGSYQTLDPMLSHLAAKSALFFLVCVSQTSASLKMETGSLCVAREQNSKGVPSKKKHPDLASVFLLFFFWGGGDTTNKIYLTRYVSYLAHVVTYTVTHFLSGWANKV